MKRIVILSFFVALAFSLFAQIHNPVKWKVSGLRLNETEAEIHLEATLEDGWHIYSQNLAEGGPIPTTITLDKAKGVSKNGIAEEKGELESVNDPNFGMTLNYFSHSVTFVQKVNLLKETAKVSGNVEFMVCDSMMCLPPFTEKFEVLIPAISQTNNQILWGIFIAGFLGGLLALLTPCVFPMIPLTVSFFTKKSSKAKGTGNALIYGLSIVVIYVALGFIITKILGPNALNAMASNIYFNLAFFVLILVFAISFLGAFEITLPHSWINKVDAASEKRGLFGIFLMAFTLALVSFSCTGPIIGTLLVETATMGHVKGPLIGMTGFAIALALPFTIFAIFPNWMHALPKSGSWLNAVKVTLGFLELALAFKFLSNVDLAYHWGILDRDTFLIIWIAIFSFLTLYLLCFIHLEHDTEYKGIKYISLTRMFTAMISFSFTLYLIPGLWGAPLKMLSGVIPPIQTQDFILGQTTITTTNTETKKFGNLFHCPNNLDCFFDYDDGLAYAKKVGKPVLLDFTGHSCANCRKMEVSVWSDPRVAKILSEKYVLVSLYVDDKTELAENEKYTSNFGNKIETLGGKWSDLQATKYNTNSQPFYAILNSEGEQLVPPQGYNLDIENYIQFLETGLKGF